MKLPNPERAFVAEEKVRDYLLSPFHPVGRHKAAFFKSLGLSQENWEVLERAIREFPGKDATLIEETEYGKKYEIVGVLRAGPEGHSASIVTAWIVLDGEDFPRFITAYPEN